MRLSFLLLIIPLIPASASSYAQGITLSKQNATLPEVFQELRKQTDYTFVYSNTQISNAKKVNIAVTNAPIIEVLDRCFEDQPLTYTINNKTITISAKEIIFFERIIKRFRLIDVQGIIQGENDLPLSGTTIKVKGSSRSTRSNEKGEFILSGVDENAILVISYLGYKTREVTASQNLDVIKLALASGDLEEVKVVTTGYQDIPKERVTGSFVIIDSALLNRSVGTNIIDRLDGIASGLLLTRSPLAGVDTKLMIRGRSTIFGEEQPLIVVDNFPYEGDLSNINPNDIKSINILKDAAAASIWGTRAGNGVIVITTYKGNYQSKQQISFNTNITFGEKPDLNHIPWFSSSEWLEIEQFLFNKGAYNTIINNGYGVISPAVEIMNQRKKNNISSADSLNQINTLKQYDVRDDMLKYLYRPSVNQQYAFNIRGGGTQNKYFVSAGYDRNLSSSVADNYKRFTLNANNTYRLLNDKLELTTGLTFTTSSSKSNNQAYRNPGSPYERLADNNGNALAVRNGLRLGYVDTVGNGQLLDWHYRPLDEREPRSNSALTSYILNAGLNYSVTKDLKASILYQYQKQVIERETDFDENSFYTRDLINRYSTINSVTGTVTRPIPLGSILNDSRSQLTSNYGRFQLNYNKSITSIHNITAIAGLEVRDNFVKSIEQRFYGFNRDLYTNTNSTINFTKDYPLYYNPGNTVRLDAQQSSGYLLDRYFSYFANASYTLMDRYVLSLSARKDESNLFGVKPNQKGVPLWSAGVLWNISKESFYNISWMPYLKLRGSFGYSGNVNKSISAYLTASPGGNNVYGQPYSLIVNPPNPSLKWERVKIINLGLDFETKNNRISGSIEPYMKYGLDLFGESPLAPQTGMVTFTGNTANTLTKGLDVSINTINLNGSVKWYTNFLFSINKDKVTKYLVANGTNSNVITSSTSNPLEGSPYFSIYAYKWAGLDNVGDPLVFFNGQPSKVYGTIANSLDRNNIKYIGSSVPTKFGSIRNTLSYKSIDLSFNITYRLGYYFRRNSLNNASVYSTTGFGSNVDYDAQWRNPGDENVTTVPALRYPNVAQRNNIYTYSDILIEKADNVRFQDIKVNWSLKNLKAINKYFSNLQFYCYINNLGYLWKANKRGLDPDTPRPEITMTSFPRTIAFGLKADL